MTLREEMANMLEDSFTLIDESNKYDNIQKNLAKHWLVCGMMAANSVVADAVVNDPLDVLVTIGGVAEDFQGWEEEMLTKDKKNDAA
jgi:hypothetical protein